VLDESSSEFADHSADIKRCGVQLHRPASAMAVARYCARHAQCLVLIAPVPAMARSRGAGRLARAVAFAAEESLRSSDRTESTSI
jgi:hypothetical protein